MCSEAQVEGNDFEGRSHRDETPPVCGPRLIPLFSYVAATI